MGKTIVADKTAKQIISDVTGQLMAPGEINLEWNDIKPALIEGEKTIVAVGRGSGQNRTSKACEDALAESITNLDVKVVSGIVAHITGPEDLLLSEVNDAVSMVQRVVSTSVEVKFGVAHDSNLKDEIRIILLIPQGYEYRAGEDFEIEVLRIARNKKGFIFYQDFYHLKPNTKGYHWLFQVKKILTNNGYVCHERNQRSNWGCSYSGNHTHFHNAINYVEIMKPWVSLS